jgi:hypothetical protein
LVLLDLTQLQEPQYFGDIVVVDQLAVKLYAEYQEATDIQEALKWDVALQGKSLKCIATFGSSPTAASAFIGK